MPHARPAKTAQASAQVSEKPPMAQMRSLSSVDTPMLQRQASCACGGGCPRCQSDRALPSKIQTKLAISEPGDRYEQEADRIADQVLRPSIHSRQIQVNTRMRGEKDMGQNQEASSSELLEAPPLVHEVLSSPGQPLDAKVRNFMESRFGYDFQSVRVHTDSRAAESAQSIEALAYTQGKNVVFGTGQYAPESFSGRELLAHELTHVVQQTASEGSETVGIYRQEQPQQERYIPPSATAGRLVYAEEIFQKSPEVRPLNDANFTNIFYDRNKVIVVDFWASWCRPCDDVAAHTAYMARRFASGPYAGRVKFYHAQLEDSVNPKLNQRFGFDAIPVVYFYFTGTGRQPSRQAPLLEGSIQGGESSVDDYEWRIQAILKRHGLLVESTNSKTEKTLQRYSTNSKSSGKFDTLPHQLTSNDSHIQRFNPILATPVRIQRQPATPPGAIELCQIESCSTKDQNLIAGDLREAQSYVSQALIALQNPTALDDKTLKALDWFFGSQKPSIVRTIKERLEFIEQCISETQASRRFGCDPDAPGEAYMLQNRDPIGKLQITNICFTSNHLAIENARQRATTVIHECGHRIGLSPPSEIDFYSDRIAFRFLDTAQALTSTESYAEFAAAIAKGVKRTQASTLGLSFGQAFLSGASNTWVGRLYYYRELQHPRNRLPVVSWVNPFLGIGFTMIGESTTDKDSSLSVDKSLLSTLVLGARFGDPRPGKGGSFSFSTFVAPLGISTQLVESGGLKGKGFAAEAGMTLNYNWNWIHFSVGASVGYNGVREAGLEKFFTLAGSVGIDGAKLIESLQ